MYNNFEISLVVFIPNITTNHAITYTNEESTLSWYNPSSFIKLIQVVLMLTSVFRIIFMRTKVNKVNLNLTFTQRLVY